MQYKIVDITIYDKLSNVVRDIHINDYFFVIGQNNKSKEKKTSNGLGKTVLIKLISFCLCGNNDSSIKSLNGYSIKLVLFDKKKKKVVVERTIGDKKVIINKNEYSLNTAKESLNIDRNKLEHIIHKDERDGIILDKPNKYDLQNAAMDILGLNFLREMSNQITNLDDQRIKQKERINICKSNISETNNTKIKLKIDDINKKLNKIQNFDKDELLNEINDLILVNQELHIDRNNLLEKKYYYQDRLKTISTYLSSIDANPKNVVNFIKQVKSELGDIIEIKMDKALEYHRIMTSERAELLNNEKNKIEKQLKQINQEIDNLGKKIAPIKDRINEKDEIKRYIDSQKALIDELKRLSAEQAFAIEIEKGTEILDEIKKEKLTKLIELKNIDISDLKDEFSKYTSNLVKKMYGTDAVNCFEIEIVDSKNIGQTKYPVRFVFNIPKDDSEGINNVKNLIIDLMMLKYSKEIECMIWDSSVFNGVDPKQLHFILKEMHDIVIKTKKQVIVCLSSFQLDKYYETFKNELRNENMIILSEDESLLKRRF